MRYFSYMKTILSTYINPTIERQQQCTLHFYYSIAAKSLHFRLKMNRSETEALSMIIGVRLETFVDKTGCKASHWLRK